MEAAIVASPARMRRVLSDFFKISVRSGIVSGRHHVADLFSRES